ncbi:MAG: 16S rRNA (cytidine(1402)-2'-O)-methyltransferase [Nitrospinaceae bacterium]|nr:16S rRNA (cytidine(1402)-2'-O)-methyltransferase [Nitrospinaceae bacterium]
MKNEKRDSLDQGTIYIVSTPIGNLGDFTQRAVEILSTVSLIAAEDTRRTRILLNRYEIQTPLSSYNSYNKFKKGPLLMSRLKKGESIALVSDAGTPGVSDPLYHLVQLAIDEGVSVNAVPGPSALLAALTVSGLPMDKFVFEGFLPRKKGRATRLAQLAEEKRTLVIFESPNRIQKTLKDILTVFGNRQVAIARELTKIHEETIRGNLEDIGNQDRKWKGELTLVIEGSNEKKRKR